MEKLIQYRTKASLYDGAFDSVVGWSAAGMGYLLITKNGNLVVIDGGFGDDAEDLLDLIKENSTSEIPKIDLWIITHPHIDHYGALREIANNEKFRGRITVEKVLYWFPMEFCGKDGKPGMLANANEHLEAIVSVLGAEYHRPTLDEKMIIGGTKLHFLYVPDDCTILNTGGGNANLCSLIFTINGEKQRAMITGDAYGRTMQVTAWRYKKALACDILQMPHHGLCDAYNADFYREVDPKVLLIPISIAGNRAMHSDLYAGREGRECNMMLENAAQMVHKAFEGNAIIEL